MGKILGAKWPTSIYFYTTTATNAYEDGTITDAQRSAFLKVNGHSSATSKQYYERISMVNTVNLALDGYNVITGGNLPHITNEVHAPVVEIYVY